MKITFTLIAFVAAAIAAPIANPEAAPAAEAAPVAEPEAQGTYASYGMRCFHCSRDDADLCLQSC
jgi:hypothetical protein